MFCFFTSVFLELSTVAVVQRYAIMISTRQLIFIISIVLFFVNRATSGNIGSTSASRERAENVKVVNQENINCCIVELTTAFQRHENGFDYLLYAFINLSKADFEKNKYTQAACGYFYDLLNTAHDIIQPVLENPRKYCENHYGYLVENCIRNITELGCEADDDAIFCVKNLYLKWKKRYLSNVIPVYGTEHISDEDLAAAIYRGTNIFPGLTTKDLLKRLSDPNLLKDFYNRNKDRHKNIQHLMEMRYSRDQTASNNYNKEYSTQLSIDVKEARNECYGIPDKDYEELMKEYNRRQKNRYAMYLYNEVESWGQTQLDLKEKNKFQDPENFCKSYLSNNSDYYGTTNY